MKKRTKLSLRTTIYLTIVALLALTGVFYAANPDKFATASKSVAAPDAPMAHPTPFAMLEGPNGVAALPDVVLATQQLSQNLSAIDCQGNVTTVATIPGAVGSPVEKYLAVAPAQSTAAGFTPRDVFITQGTDIFKFSGGIVTPFATLGCPVSTHSSLTFDHVGTFGNKMIATCENGPVWTVAENPITHLGDVTFIAIVNSGGSTEGPAIAPTPGPGGVPPGFGPLGGQILVADDENGQVHAIDYHAGHAVTLNVFNWVSPDWLGAESINVIPNTPCANCSEGAYFQAIFDGGLHPNTIIKFPLTDFIGLGGSILVNSESIPGHGTALVSFNPVTNAYETTVFDNEVGRQEGASFVDCDVPTPTPSPTPTPEIPTPTPSPTPTATPATCTGLFVIGDRDAVVGQHVTFWGAQWWKKNHLSGGTAPASFKGFANCANPPCGGTWISDPGNSSHPPDTVPADMTVIVSSLITKSGPIESGNIPMMVTIHTDPGYQPNPGHEGTGTVTAVVCGSAHRPQYHQPARPARPPR